MSPAPRIPAKRAGWLHSIEGGGASEEAPLSDEELIAAVVRGDGAVASELYDRLLQTVEHTLYRILGRRESDHEDLIQSAFEQVVKTLTTRRFAGACSLKTWAGSVAANVGLNALRSRRRERAVIERSHDDHAADGRAKEDPEREVGARRELDEVRRALAGLNPGRAEAVFLHDVLGHDLAEIAAFGNITIAAAQSRLVRGRRDLMQQLERGRK
jgi:RNA polymerase sigma-70 factor (ECF subfamily)